MSNVKAETDPAAILRRTPYHVEVDDGGCVQCCAGKAWTVVGPDDVAVGRTFGVEEDADDLSADMNDAYAEGIKSVAGQDDERETHEREMQHPPRPDCQAEGWHLCAVIKSEPSDVHTDRELRCNETMNGRAANAATVTRSECASDADSASAAGVQQTISEWLTANPGNPAVGSVNAFLRQVAGRIEQIRNQLDAAINLVSWCLLDRIDRDLRQLKSDMGFPKEGLGECRRETGRGATTDAQSNLRESLSTQPADLGSRVTPDTEGSPCQDEASLTLNEFERAHAADWLRNISKTLTTVPVPIIRRNLAALIASIEGR